jgi:hypothetical protein
MPVQTLAWLGQDGFPLLSEAFSSRRFSYQLFQPFQPRCFLFCTHYPPPDRFSIRRRLSVKELPGGFVLPQPFLVRSIETGAPLLVGINSRAVFFPRVKRSHSEGLQQAFIAQFSCALDVDRAPNASASPWRKSNRVTQIINALANPVDPTETKRLIHRFRPGDARLPRAFLVITEPQFLRGRVILLQPSAKIVR